MTELLISGCATEPLGDYLKALGLMRVMGDRAVWRGDRFYLLTRRSIEELIEFLNSAVVYTAIASPWNGTSGFWKGPKTRALEQLIDELMVGAAPQTSSLRKVYAQARQIVDESGLTRQPKKGEQKNSFIQKCQQEIRDEGWQRWLETCSCFAQNKKGKTDLIYSNLTGTVGNVGLKDIGANFLQALSHLLDFKTGEPTPEAQRYWRAALFCENEPNTAVEEAIGAQFFPATDFVLDAKKFPYFESGSSTATSNPADVVLMSEGLTAFSSFARRVNDSEDPSKAYYSLAVSLNDGWAETAVSKESRSGVEEFWLPLFDEPMNFRQFRRTLSKILVGRLPRHGLVDSMDFAAEVAAHAEEYEIARFQRVGFFKRKGQSNFAVSLGIFTPNPQGDIGPELTGYRKRLASLARQDNVPQTLRDLNRQLERRLLDMTSGHGSVLAVLRLLGRLELYVGRSPALQLAIGPLRQLEGKWVIRAFDESNTPTVRLALSLASLWFRSRCSPALPNKEGNWFWGERAVRWGNDWVSNTIHMQRQWAIDERPYPEANRRIGSRFEDISAFLYNRIDLKELEELAVGFSLCDIPTDIPIGQLTDNVMTLPAVLLLTSFCHWEDWGSLEVVNALERGDTLTAKTLCWSKLRQHELSPLEFPADIHSPRMAAAAVAFPLAESQLRHIQSMLMEV